MLAFAYAGTMPMTPRFEAMPVQKALGATAGTDSNA